MTIYSIDTLIEETRRLATEFRRSTGQMLPVSGEIARYDVVHHLNMTADTTQQAGIDAISKGLKIQIKGRVITDEEKSSYRIGQINPNGDWDAIVLSLMDENFEPYEMYQLNKQDFLDSNASSKQHKRGALSVAKFKIIGQLVWTKEHGMEPDMWTNQ